jgi:LptD protein
VLKKHTKLRFLKQRKNIHNILRLSLICFFFSISLFSVAQRPFGAGGGGNPFGGFGSPSPSNNSTGNNSRANKTRAAVKRDTLHSVIPDSLRSKGNGLETTVNYAAEDSTVLDVSGKVVNLYGKASVDYGNITLKADYIRLDWDKSEVFAHGSVDTSKASGVKGKPIFSQGADTYNTDTIRYNFKSRKAIIKGIVTQQGEGFVQGAKVKKDADDDMYLVTAKYTTCNLQDPHFYIAARKIKLVNKKSIISGSFNFVLNDIPLPIGLPFGFFPVPKNKELGTPGVLIGSYGEEPNGRGFYLRDFGYYVPINENIGMKVLGQIYTKGSWGIGVQSNYIKRYKYGGNLNFNYNFNKSGAEVLPASSPPASTDFSLTWSHSPQSRRPDRSFSASVNLQSNGYARNNTLLNQQYGGGGYLNNALGSSIQYSRTLSKNIRLGTSLRVDQNVSTKVLNTSLDYNFGVTSFNPFVPEKKKLGKWYESFRVGLDISGGFSATNDVTYQTRSTTYYDYNVLGVSQQQLTQEELRQQSLGFANSATKTQSVGSVSELFDMLNKGQFRTTYSVPISLPNFKIARYINFSPSVSLQGDIYTKQLNYQYFDKYNPDPTVDKFLNNHKNKEGGSIYKTGANGVLIDTLKGFFPTFRYSYSGGFNTRVYGTYQFGKKGRLAAIRHTILPSISIGYSPDLTEAFTQNTRVRFDTISGKYVYRNLSRYVGVSGSQIESGSMGFSLSNQFEAKIRSKSDTAKAEFTKLSLLDNLSLNGSYNFLAPDSIGKMSNISISANTTILKGLVSLNASANLDPYFYEDSPLGSDGKPLFLSGVRTSSYAWRKGQGLGHLTYVNLSIGTRLTPEGFKGKVPPTPKAINPNLPNDPSRDAQLKFIKQNPDLYVDFNIPWTLSINYNLNYNKNGLAPSLITQALTFQGDLSLTPKWKISFNTGWDFQFKTATLSTINIHRDLHCWDMAFSWTPIAGSNYRASSFSFDLKPKAALLQELKLSRRRTASYNGGY